MNQHFTYVMSFVIAVEISPFKFCRSPWIFTIPAGRNDLNSHAPDAEKLGDLVRRQSGIENHCQWVLDMTFDEDSCRARKGHAAENLGLLRKLMFNFLRHDQTTEDTMRRKRIRAALCEKTLQTLMKLDPPE